MTSKQKKLENLAMDFTYPEESRSALRALLKRGELTQDTLDEFLDKWEELKTGKKPRKTSGFLEADLIEQLMEDDSHKWWPYLNKSQIYPVYRTIWRGADITLTRNTRVEEHGDYLHVNDLPLISDPRLYMLVRERLIEEPNWSYQETQDHFLKQILDLDPTIT